VWYKDSCTCPHGWVQGFLYLPPWLDTRILVPAGVLRSGVLRSGVNMHRDHGRISPRARIRVPTPLSWRHGEFSVGHEACLGGHGFLPARASKNPWVIHVLPLLIHVLSLLIHVLPLLIHVLSLLIHVLSLLIHVLSLLIHVLSLRRANRNTGPTFASPGAGSARPFLAAPSSGEE